MGQTAKITNLVPPDFSRSKMHNRTLKAVYRGGLWEPCGPACGPARGRARAGLARAGTGLRGRPRGLEGGLEEGL